MSFRQARESDVEATYRVYLAAAEELNGKLGRSIATTEHSPATRALAVRRSALQHDPDRFWVAEAGGEIAGFGIAIHRDGLLYLAALHVLPAFQRAGIGAELLRRCMAPAPRETAAAGRAICLTISEAANVAATGLYARHGLQPAIPILQLTGDISSEAPQSGSALLGIDPAEAAERLRPLDAQVLGIERDPDHATWCSIPTVSPFLLQRQGQACGYIYLDAAGFIGPAAALSPELLAEATLLGLVELARTGVRSVHLRVPGAARPTLAMLWARNFRLEVGINLLLSDEPLTAFDRYLMSGADALF